MNAELKEKWVAALRSGEYKQGVSQLYDGEGYCCLGVLCKVAEEEGLLKDVFYENSYPPVDFMESQSLDTNPRVKIGSIEIELSSLNDSGFHIDEIKDVLNINRDESLPEFDFNYLANLIEEQL